MFTTGRLTVANMHKHEVLMMRMTGSVVVFLGYFHLQGARSAGSFFVATVILSSLVIQPLGTLVLFLLGLRLQICLVGALVPVGLVVARRLALRLLTDEPNSTPQAGEQHC